MFPAKRMSLSTRPHSRLHTLSALLLCVAAGCGKGTGPELASVSGKVTLNGKPIPRARITFVPNGKGSPSYGATDAQGSYRLDYSRARSGARVGPHSVRIEEPEIAVGDDGPAKAEPSLAIPAEYLKPGALTAQVQPGRNTIDFSLASQQPVRQ